MSHWDGEKIIRYKPHPVKDYPGWEVVDCGCCHGIEWGGEDPRECNRCEGSGWIHHHIKSNIFALYPGGPFTG